MTCFNTPFVHSTYRGNQALWLFFLFGLFLSNAGMSQPFISTWATNVSGTSNNTSITIPISGSGYNYDVDWDNDGVFDQFGISGSVTHDFGKTGTYTIRIQGSFPRIYFNNSGDKNKLQSIEQWGNIKWSSMENAFYGCSNLKITAQDSPDLSNVSSMSGMFRQAGVSAPAIGKWNVSKVTNMEYLFFATFEFNLPIGDWDVSSVTTMKYMFANTFAFNQPIGAWDVSNYDSTLIGWDQQVLPKKSWEMSFH